MLLLFLSLVQMFSSAPCSQAQTSASKHGNEAWISQLLCNCILLYLMLPEPCIVNKCLFVQIFVRMRWVPLYGTYPWSDMTFPALSTQPPLSIAAKYWQREDNIHLWAFNLRPPTSTVTSGLISSRNILSKSSPNLETGPLRPAYDDEASVSSVLPSITNHMCACQSQHLKHNMGSQILWQKNIYIIQN